MKAPTRTAGALGLAAAALVLALSGCGSPGMSGSGTTAAPTPTEQFTSAPAATTEPAPSASDTGSTPAAAGPATILIKGFKYQGTDTVQPRSGLLRVTNEDIEAHTITADTGNAFDANTKVGTTTFTAPTEPGTYPYHCIFHGNMKGTLIVK